MVKSVRKECATIGLIGRDDASGVANARENQGRIGQGGPQG